MTQLGKWRYRLTRFLKCGSEKRTNIFQTIVLHNDASSQISSFRVQAIVTIIVRENGRFSQNHSQLKNVSNTSPPIPSGVAAFRLLFRTFDRNYKRVGFSRPKTPLKRRRLAPIRSEVWRSAAFQTIFSAFLLSKSHKAVARRINVGLNGRHPLLRGVTRDPAGGWRRGGGYGGGRAEERPERICPDTLVWRGRRTC